MLQKILYAIKVVKLASKRFYDEHYTYRASALAFTTLLSIVPLFVVIVFLVTKFPIFAKINQLAQNYILENFIVSTNNSIQFYLNNFTYQAIHLPLLGIIFLLLTGLMLVLTIEETFNDIWGVSWHNRRIIPLFLTWIVLLIAPILIGVGLLVSTFLFSLSWISSATEILGLKAPLLACLPLVMNTIIFSLLYIIVPNYQVKWKDGFIGGFISAILFELAKIAFAFYIKRFPNYEMVYGALAAIPIFLLWLYISWLIILFGALVTHTQSNLREQQIKNLPK
jgi:membrane protein